MDTQFSSLQSKKYVWLLIILVGAAGIYCFYKPLIISIDSVYGFLAYKGSVLSHSFNTIADVSARNISQTDLTFESWWSPGQWLYPGFLNYFFGTRLGVASIIVTIISSVFGFLGYYKVFTFLRFSFPVTVFSLLLIFSSCTFYYSFIIYQGGETLEFAFFPWFLLYILRLKKINSFSLLTTTIFFVLCYIAKTTLVLYCSIIVIYKSIQPVINNYINNRKINLHYNSLLLLLPLTISNLFIHYFFVSRGLRIGLLNHFKVYAASFMVPLTSPLTSILSIQQWMHRIEKIVSLKNHTSLFANSMYLLILIAVIIIATKIYRHKNMNVEYKWLLLFLYAGLSCFFITAYCFEANIDFNSRHFKLLGFLCVPGILTIINQFIKPVHIPVLTVLCCLIATADILYLKQKWTAGRYLSVNHFYRNDDNLQTTDSMNEGAYKKLISLDKSISLNNNLPAIFYIESNTDIALDLRHQCIIQKKWGNISAEKYEGKGPLIIACITKQTIDVHKGFLKNKFPDYNNFQLIGETDSYYYFKLD
jgi:hypothetical protein